MGFDKTIRAEDKEHANKLLQHMQEPVTYAFPSKKVPFLKKIPFMSGFVTDSGDLGYEAVHFSSAIQELRDIIPGDSGVSGFHIGAVVVAALDFVLVPAIYLSAYIFGEKVPFTLTNNARWAYSAVLLGLTLSALLVPAAAPYIGLAAAGATLAFSAFLLGKALYERYQLGRERRAIRKEIAAEEEELQRIQNEAKDLQTYLNAVTDEKQLGEIFQHVAVLQKQYDTQKNKLGALKEQEQDVEQKIKKLGVIQIMDKGLAVSFAAIAVLGLALSLFFPPVGFGIVIGVSALGVAYATARITYPMFRALGNWAIDKFRDAFVAEAIEPSNVNQPKPTPGEKVVMSHAAEPEQSYEVMEHLLGIKEVGVAPEESAASDAGLVHQVVETKEEEPNEQESEGEGEGEESECHM